MPMYDYKCGACGHEATDVFRRMTNDAPEPCPVCTAAMARVPTVSRARPAEFHTPIDMYSIALNEDSEIAAFKQRAPDVDVSTDQNDPMYGIPVARTRHQKQQALRAMGYEERS